MYEGEKKKMYYSSYLVMVAARKKFFLKMQTAYLFDSCPDFIHTVLKKKATFLFPEIFFLFKKRTENERFVPSGIIFHVFPFTVAAQERQHGK